MVVTPEAKTDYSTYSVGDELSVQYESYSDEEFTELRGTVSEPAPTSDRMFVETDDGDRFALHESTDGVSPREIQQLGQSPEMIGHMVTPYTVDDGDTDSDTVPGSIQSDTDDDIIVGNTVQKESAQTDSDDSDTDTDTSTDTEGYDEVTEADPGYETMVRRHVGEEVTEAIHPASDDIAEINVTCFYDHHDSSDMVVGFNVTLANSGNDVAIQPMIRHERMIDVDHEIHADVHNEAVKAVGPDTGYIELHEDSSLPCTCVEVDCQGKQNVSFNIVIPRSVDEDTEVAIKGSVTRTQSKTIGDNI